MNLAEIGTLLEQAAGAARQAGATAAEVSFEGIETEFTRFASSRFTQVGSTRADTVRIRVIADGRLGTQMCAQLDAGALAETARATVDVARLSPTLDVPLSFAGAGDPSGDPSPGEPTPEASIAPELTARGAPAGLAQAFAAQRQRGVTFAGSLKSHRQRFAVRTTEGCARAFETTAADLQVIGIAGDATGFAGLYDTANAPLDLDAVVGEAADLALRGNDPVDLPPGAYDVVLAPAALAELLEWMSMVSFGAEAVMDGTSLLSDREGQALCDPSITVRDRPMAGEPPFDAEGTPRREVTFLDAGRGGKPVTDLITAARIRDDRGSTGHAAPITDEFATGPRPLSLRLEPGDATADDLIAKVDRGLYITRLHYVNGLLNPRKATTTGMTRDGTFLIEGGELGRGVSNLRFTEHLLEALSRPGGIGRDVTTIPAWWAESGTITCPHLLLRDFHFTGKSR